MYQNVVINHDILLSISDEFIPEGISSRIVIIADNSFERKGYRANLAKNNEENDLHYAIGSADINESGILNGCIYTDINESRQNLILKLISAIHNLFKDKAAQDHNNKPKPVINYNFYNKGKP